MTEKKSCPILRMIVIYTGDIRREEVSDSFDAGEDLSDEEQMRFIILPLTYRKKEEKERKIRETVELASKIRNREQQVFVLAGILTFTDKIIDEKTAIKIRRLIQMTKVGMIIAKEQEEAVKAARDEERRKAQEAVSEERRKAQEAVSEERRKAQEAVNEERQKAQEAVNEERQKAQEAVNGERRKAWKTIKEEKQKNQEEKRDSVLKMLQDGLISPGPIPRSLLRDKLSKK